VSEQQEIGTPDPATGSDRAAQEQPAQAAPAAGAGAEPGSGIEAAAPAPGSERTADTEPAPSAAPSVEEAQAPAAQPSAPAPGPSAAEPAAPRPAPATPPAPAPATPVATAPPTPDAASDPQPPTPVPRPAAAEPAAPRQAPPRPGPRPVPGPPRPGSAAGPAAVPTPPPVPPTAAAEPAPDAPEPTPTSTVPAASADPGRWGRVDAEGTIYVRTADGERVVGSWQAGEPQEGLTHFARRFDDMLTEVELLANRLTAGGGEPKHALSTAKSLRDGLDEATVVGDLVGLRARLDALVEQAEAAVSAARSARDAQRAAAIARKEALAVEAETLAAEATQWKQAGDRFKGILDEWRTIRGIDRKTDELLWKRFSKARESFNRRRGSHFADLDRQRSAARVRKEELVVEAESLSDSQDWGPTAARFRELMVEWKSAGRAQKDADDSLWQRFRGAQDAFFARRSETFAERDAEFVANAEAKKALLTEAERIDTSDPTSARAALRSLQERWEEIGKVPREDINPLEARLRAVEERVRDAADRQWRRTDPEAEARVAQFRERVAQFEAQAEKAAAAGDARRAEQAKGQAEQWREWLATAEQAVQHR
jgi:hypothetical protein